MFQTRHNLAPVWEPAGSVLGVVALLSIACNLAIGGFQKGHLKPGGGALRSHNLFVGDAVFRAQPPYVPRISPVLALPRQLLTS